MSGSPIDFGPIILIALVGVIGAGVVISAFVVLGTRAALRSRSEAAGAGADEIADAQRSLRAMARGDQPPAPGGDEFLVHAQQSMLLVSQARTANRLPDVAALLTPAYYDTLIAEQRANPQPAAQLDIELEAARVREVNRGRPQDEVVAWFGATMTLHAAGGNSPPITTTVAAETWRFVRAADLPDAPDALLAARVCPNCGASLGSDTSGVCPFCRQVLVGNTHGWLVSGIEIDAVG